VAGALQHLTKSAQSPLKLWYQCWNLAWMLLLKLWYLKQKHPRQIPTLIPSHWYWGL